MNQHATFFSQVSEEEYMGRVVELIFKPEQETYKVGDNNLFNIDIYRKHKSILLSVSHLELRHNTSTSSTIEVKIELKNEDSCTSVLCSLRTHMQLPVFITMEAIELEQETSIRTKIEDLTLYFSEWPDQTKRIVKKWLTNYLAKGIYELSSVKYV